MPKVSIGLPVYNGARYLRSSIESVLVQTFGDFELIISDNASTDATADISREYAKKDRRVRYHRNDFNIGAARNYNKTFGLSTGKYFKWVSHDDEVRPTYLEKCIEVLDGERNGVVLCYPRTAHIDDSGTVIGDYVDNMDLRQEKPADRFRHLMRHLRQCNSIFGLIRADALRRTHLIGQFLGSDTVLLAELSLLGEFREVSDQLFHRRMHDGMSRKANSTPHMLASWFDPALKDKRLYPMSRRGAEFLRAVSSSPLPMGEKLTCYSIVMDGWFKRYWRQIGSECRLAMKSFFLKKA